MSELCQKPICFGRWGYLSSEKQMPQVIGNKQKWEEAIEGLESSRRLAKQVFSSPGGYNGLGNRLRVGEMFRRFKSHLRN